MNQFDEPKRLVLSFYLIESLKKTHFKKELYTECNFHTFTWHKIMEVSAYGWVVLLFCIIWLFIQFHSCFIDYLIKAVDTIGNYSK